ncbi:hypothetical protein [Streptomyces gobitricini]|uniref:hypothetical protein n=1 Tax=Streptomyces gobitricini TaxID=68211 RepID=UPI0031E1D5A6
MPWRSDGTGGRRAAARDDGTPVGPLRAYLALLGFTVLIPMTVICFAVLVIGSRAIEAPAPAPIEQAAFGLAAFLAPAGRRLLLAGGGALIIALAVALLLSAP